MKSSARLKTEMSQRQTCTPQNFSKQDGHSCDWKRYLNKITPNFPSVLKICITTHKFQKRSPLWGGESGFFFNIHTYLSIPKEISPEYSLQGLMLKLKLQSFGHLMWRTDSFQKTLILGKIEGRRRRGRQRMRWLDGITNSTDMSMSWTWKWTGRPGVLQSMGSQRAGHDWATELNWYISEI